MAAVAKSRREDIVAPGDVRRTAPFALPPVKGDPAWEAYMTSCNHYLARQILVYQNWPQRKWTPLGLSQEKVFNDQNA